MWSQLFSLRYYICFSTSRYQLWHYKSFSIFCLVIDYNINLFPCIITILATFSIQFLIQPHLYTLQNCYNLSSLFPLFPLSTIHFIIIFFLFTSLSNVSSRLSRLVKFTFRWFFVILFNAASILDTT